MIFNGLSQQKFSAVTKSLNFLTKIIAQTIPKKERFYPPVQDKVKPSSIKRAFEIPYSKVSYFNNLFLWLCVKSFFQKNLIYYTIIFSPLNVH